MNRIKLLAKNTYDKIAAGEVVERPASIIKELVENSIDAGSTKIDIEIQSGGIKQIIVRDNGCGIHSEDVELAFVSHATSKIKDVEDLYSIKTLGFRGEALSSIAAVSQLEMFTKTQDEQLGVKIKIHGSEIIDKTEIAVQNGTTIYVNNLFYNVPVRLKFLRKPKTEETEITNLVEKLILSNPDISFKYIIDNKIYYQTRGSGLFDAVYTIYGDLAKSLIEVKYSMNGYQIKGFISKPENCKANRTYQTLLLNGRIINSPIISNAIQIAYENFLMKGKFPFYVIHLTVPSDTVDVNVHPNKKEVKFEDTNKIFGLFNSVIYKHLYESDHIVDVKLNLNNQNTTEEKSNESTYVENETRQENNIPNAFEKIKKFEKQDSTILTFNQIIAPDNVEEVILEDSIIVDKENKIDSPVFPSQTNNQLKIEEVFDNFQIIGTVFATYIIIEKDNNLYIIDQHAAHERQLYDNLIKQVNNNDVVTQDLLEPYLLQVNEVEKNFILTNKASLTKHGFNIEDFGRKTLKISTIPFILSQINLKTFFDNILEDLDRLTKKPIAYINEFFTQKACKAAIKAGKLLTEQEIKILLNNFVANKNVLLCPHGRPIITSITKKEFEKMFKRID